MKKHLKLLMARQKSRLKDVKLLSLPTRQEVSLPGIEDHCSDATTFPVITAVPFLPFAPCVISHSFHSFMFYVVMFHPSSAYFTRKSNDGKRQRASCQAGNKLWFHDVLWTLQIHVNVLKTSKSCLDKLLRRSHYAKIPSNPEKGEASVATMHL